MTVSVFCGVSVDGFLARRDGALDFLDAGGSEPHGYEEFMATIDAIVIGRNTYDIVLAFDAWPYTGKRAVVLSSQDLDLSTAKGPIELMRGEPKEIVEKLAATGSHSLYVDGGITIQRFLVDGLVDRLIVTRVPVLIGDGIPLFGALAHDVLLEHVGTRTYKGGNVQTEYRIVASSQ